MIRWRHLPVVFLGFLSFEAEALETVWVQVAIASDDTVLCQSIAGLAPEALTGPALEAARSRSYAEALRQPVPLSLNYALWRATEGNEGALHGFIGVHFDVDDAGAATVRSIELIGEGEPSVLRIDIMFEVVLNQAGRIVSSTPVTPAADALYRLARQAMAKYTAADGEEQGSLETTALTVTLFIFDADQDRVSVITGPVIRQPRTIELKAARYPSKAFKAGVVGWTEVAYTVNARGRVKDARIVCSEPPDVFDENSLRATKGFSYVPDTLDGKRVSSREVRTKMLFAIQ